MFGTFELFESRAGQRFDQLRAEGAPVEKVLIDVDDLVAWRRAENRPVDADARAAFAAMTVMLRDPEGRPR